MKKTEIPKASFIPVETWKNYELIDSGHFEKLERFGRYVLRRPEPQAVWDKSLDVIEWEKQADATFARNNPVFSDESQRSEKGEWSLKKNMPQQWMINYENEGLNFKMRLGLTAFGHIGVFPEQAGNWDYIFNTIKSLNFEKPEVLNLFAYTGGATVAARAAGALTVHLDSVKQVVNWAKENMELNNYSEARWLVEDAQRFVQREIRRGNQYDGIILDPPAYGRGPSGEKWVLENHINELLKNCKQLLKPTNSFFVLNLYSLGFSSLIALNLINAIFDNPANIEYGEFYLPDQFGKVLPLGTFIRFRR